MRLPPTQANPETETAVRSAQQRVVGEYADALTQALQNAENMLRTMGFTVRADIVLIEAAAPEEASTFLVYGKLNNRWGLFLEKRRGSTCETQTFDSVSLALRSEIAFEIPFLVIELRAAQAGHVEDLKQASARLGRFVAEFPLAEDSDAYLDAFVLDEDT